MGLKLHFMFELPDGTNFANPREFITRGWRLKNLECGPMKEDLESV